MKQTGVNYVLDAKGAAVGLGVLSGDGTLVAYSINGKVYGWCSEKNEYVTGDVQAIRQVTGKTWNVKLTVGGKQLANKATEIKGFDFSDSGFVGLSEQEKIAVGNFVATYQLGSAGLLTVGQTALFLNGKYVGIGLVDANGKLTHAAINGVIYALGKAEGAAAGAERWYADTKTGRSITKNTATLDPKNPNHAIPGAVSAKEIAYDFSGTKFASMSTADQTSLGNFLAGYGIGGMKYAGTFLYGKNGVQLGVAQADWKNGVPVFHQAVIGGVIYAFGKAEGALAGTEQWYSDTATGKNLVKNTAALDPKNPNHALPGAVSAQELAYDFSGTTFASMSTADQTSLGNFLVSAGISKMKFAGTYLFDNRGTLLGMASAEWKNGVPIFHQAVINGVVYAWGKAEGAFSGMEKWYSDAATGKNVTKNTATLDPKNPNHALPGALSAKEIAYDFSGTKFASMSEADQKALGQFMASYGIGGMKFAGTYLFGKGGTLLGMAAAEWKNGVPTLQQAMIKGVVYAWGKKEGALIGTEQWYSDTSTGKNVAKYVVSLDPKKNASQALPGGAVSVRKLEYDFSGTRFAGMSELDRTSLGQFLAANGIGGMRFAGTYMYDANGKEIGIAAAAWRNGIPTFSAAYTYADGKVYAWVSVMRAYVTGDASKITNNPGKNGVIIDAAGFADRWETAGSYNLGNTGFTGLNPEEISALGSFVAQYGLGNSNLKVAGLTTFYSGNKAVWTGVLDLQAGETLRRASKLQLDFDKAPLSRPVLLENGKSASLNVGGITDELVGTKDPDLKIFISGNEVVGAYKGHTSAIGNIIFFQTTDPSLMFQRDQQFGDKVLLLVNTTTNTVVDAWTVGTNDYFGRENPKDISVPKIGGLFGAFQQNVFESFFGSDNIKTAADFSDTVLVDRSAKTLDAERIRIFLKDGQLVGRSVGDPVAMNSWHYIKTGSREVERIAVGQLGGTLNMDGNYAVFRIRNLESGTVSIVGYDLKEDRLIRPTGLAPVDVNRITKGFKEANLDWKADNWTALQLGDTLLILYQGTLFYEENAQQGNAILGDGVRLVSFFKGGSKFETSGWYMLKADGEFLKGWYDGHDIVPSSTLKVESFFGRFFMVDLQAKTLAAFDGGSKLDYKFSENFLVLTHKGGTMELDVTYALGNLKTPVQYALYDGSSRKTALDTCVPSAGRTWKIRSDNYTADFSFDTNGRLAGITESKSIFTWLFTDQGGLNKKQTQFFAYNKAGTLVDYNAFAAGYMQDVMKWWGGLSTGWKWATGAIAVVGIGAACYFTGGAMAAWLGTGFTALGSTAATVFVGAATLFTAGSIVAGGFYLFGNRTLATEIFYIASVVGIGGALISASLTTLPSFGSYATWLGVTGISGTALNLVGVGLAFGTGAGIFAVGWGVGALFSALPQNVQRVIFNTVSNVTHWIASTWVVRAVSSTISAIVNSSRALRVIVDAATSIMMIPLKILASGFQQGFGRKGATAGFLGLAEAGGQFVMFIAMGGRQMWSWASSGVKNGSRLAAQEFLAGRELARTGIKGIQEAVLVREGFREIGYIVVGLSRMTVGALTKFVVAFLPGGVAKALGVTAANLKISTYWFLETLGADGFKAAVSFAGQELVAGLSTVGKALLTGAKDLVKQGIDSVLNAGRFAKMFSRGAEFSFKSFLDGVRTIGKVAGTIGLGVGAAVYVVGAVLKNDALTQVGKWMMIGGAGLIIASWAAATALKLKGAGAGAASEAKAAQDALIKAQFEPISFGKFTASRLNSLSSYAGPVLVAGVLLNVAASHLEEGRLKVFLQKASWGIMALGGLMFYPLIRSTLFKDGFKAGIGKIFKLEEGLVKFNPVKMAGDFTKQSVAISNGWIFARFMVDDAVHAGIFAKAYNFFWGALSNAVSAGLSWAQFDMYIRLMKGGNITERAFWVGDGSQENAEGVLGVFKMGFQLGPILGVFGNIGATKVESMMGGIFRGFLGGPASWMKSAASAGGMEFGLGEIGILKLFGKTQRESLQKILGSGGFLGHLLNPFISPLQFFSGAWAVTRLVPMLSQNIFTPALQGARFLGIIHLTDKEIQDVSQDLLFIFLPQHMTSGRMLETVREKLQPGKDGQPLFADETQVENVLKETFDNELIEQTLGVTLKTTGDTRSYTDAIGKLRGLEVHNLLARAGFGAEQLARIGIEMKDSQTSTPMTEVLAKAGVDLKANSWIAELGKYTADAVVLGALHERLFDTAGDLIFETVKNRGDDSETASRLADALGAKGSNAFFSELIDYVKVRQLSLYSLQEVANAAAEGNGVIQVRELGKIDVAVNESNIKRAFGENAFTFILAVAVTKMSNRVKSEDTLRELCRNIALQLMGGEGGRQIWMPAEVKLLLDTHVVRNHGAEILVLLTNIITFREKSPGLRLSPFNETAMRDVLDTANAKEKIQYAIQWASHEAGVENLNAKKEGRLDNDYVNTTDDWLITILKDTIFTPLAQRCNDVTEYLNAVGKVRTEGFGALAGLREIFTRAPVTRDEQITQAKTKDSAYQEYFKKAGSFFKLGEARYGDLAAVITEIKETEAKLAKLSLQTKNVKERNGLNAKLNKLTAEFIKKSSLMDKALYSEKASTKGLETLKNYLTTIDAKQCPNCSDLAGKLTETNVSEVLYMAFLSRDGMGRKVTDMRNALIEMFRNGNSPEIKGLLEALKDSGEEVARLDKSGENVTPGQKASLREKMNVIIEKQRSLKAAFEVMNEGVDKTLLNYVFLATMFEISVDFLRVKQGEASQLVIGDGIGVESGFVLGKGGESFADRPYADLYGRGNSAFLMSIGLEMGYDVSAGTGIGKTRAGLLAASFYSAIHGDGVGVFLENGDAVAKYFKLRTENQSNAVIYEQIAAALGIRIINGNDYVAEGKHDYAELLKALKESPNAVLMMDIITKTHLGNMITDASGKELLQYISQLGRKIIDEVQIPAFSMIEAIIADGNVATFAGEEAVNKGIAFCRMLQETVEGQSQNGGTLQKLSYSDFRDKFGDDVSKDTNTPAFAIAADGTVFFSKAALEYLRREGGKLGFGRYADFSSMVRVLFGPKELAAETIINGRVIHKPTDGQTLEEQQQSSDVALQIATLYKFLGENAGKQLSENARLINRAAGRTGEADANTRLDGKTGILEMGADGKLKVRGEFEVSEKNGVYFKNGRVEKIDIKKVSEWYNVEGIGRLRTKMGTPVQSSFVEGVVGLSATLPAAIRLLTGNVRLELGQSMVDLKYLSDSGRLAFNFLHDASSLKLPEKPKNQTEADYQKRTDVRDINKKRQEVIDAIKKDIEKRFSSDAKTGNLFFLATDPVYEALIKDAITSLVESNSKIGKTLQESYLEGKGKDGILSVALTTSAQAKDEIADASREGLKIVIGGLRIATGHDQGRVDEKTMTKLKEQVSTEEQLNRLDSLLERLGDQAVTHMFLLGFDNQASGLVAQALGRDRSNAGIATLYYNNAAVALNIVEAVRFPDSLLRFFKDKLEMVEGDLRMANKLSKITKDAYDALITQPGVSEFLRKVNSLKDQIKELKAKKSIDETKRLENVLIDLLNNAKALQKEALAKQEQLPHYAEAVKLYNQRLNDAQGDMDLVRSISKAVAAKTLDAGKLTEFILQKMGERGTASLIDFLNLNFSYKEASTQSNANRSIVTTLLRNEIMTKGLLKLLEWSSSYGISGNVEKLQDIISDYKEGRFSDTQPILDKKGIEGADFVKNEIQLVLNELFGQMEGGRRIETGSLIEKVSQAGFDASLIRRAFRLNEVELIDGALRQGSTAFTLDAIRGEAENSGYGRFSIANTQDGSIFDFVKTIVLFGDYILKSEQTRQESSEKAEQQHVQMAEQTNSPEMTEKKLAVDSNMGSKGAGKFIDDVLRPTGWGTTASTPGLAVAETVVSQTGTLNASQLVLGTLNNILSVFSFNATSDADTVRSNVTQVARFLTQNGLFGTRYANQIGDRLSQIAAVWGDLGLNWHLDLSQSLDNSSEGIELRRLLTSDHFEADLARFHIAHANNTEKGQLMRLYAPVLSRERRERNFPTHVTPSNKPSAAWKTKSSKRCRSCRTACKDICVVRSRSHGGNIK